MKLASAIILLVYLAFIVSRFGVLPSISDSYYRLKKWGFMFFIALISSSLLLFLSTPNELMFVAMSGIWFTATAAKFKEDITHNVHYLGAVIGFGCGIIQAASVTTWCLLPAFVIVAGLTYLYANNKIWWIEVLGLITIYAFT